MKTHTLKLNPQLDLRLSIKEFSNKNSISGFVLGIVGDLSKAVFKCPTKKDLTTIKGHLEIITLNGTFSSDNVHLHLSFSDENCRVWGGHLENGTKVLKRADILIAEITKIDSDSISPKTINRKLDVAILPNCPWSEKIRDHLVNSSLAYNLIIINNDNDFINIRQRSQSSTFPQVFLDDKYIGGYEEFMTFFKEYYS